MMVLNSHKATEKISKTITNESLSELIGVGKHVARESVPEYLTLVENVMDMAFRRIVYKELEQCRSLCFTETEDNIKDIIYSKIDKTISEFSGIDKIPKFGEVVDELWGQILDRHANGGMCGLPSKISAVNEYFTYENGELILVCAPRKEGKSIWGLGECMHKLKLGKSVLHIDTEMSSRQNMERMLSYLTKIPVKLVKSGKYEKEDGEKIQKALDWIKSKNYTHIYMPTPNLNKLYSIMKRLKHNNELDFVVYDYLKSQGATDANVIYNMLGDMCNFLKNKCCGELGIPMLALAQLNRNGDVADSFKLEQFSSTIAILKRKKPEEIQRDGQQCGNYKLYIKLNRLGEQMSSIDDEYIDLDFNGNTVTFSEAKQQHEVASPY